MTPEQCALRDAYLAELWPVCREVAPDIRAGWAAVATARNEQLIGVDLSALPVDARAA